MKKNKKNFQKNRRASAPRDHRAPKSKAKYSYPGRHGGRRAPREEELTGSYIGNTRGFGFFKPDGEEEDIFIPAPAKSGAIDGDRVRVMSPIERTGDGRREGRVIEILERCRTSFTGRLIEEEYMRSGRYVSRYTVLPDNRRLDFVAHVDDIGSSAVGDLVLCEYDPDTYKSAYRDREACVRGYILRSFGSANTRDANYEAILTECGIETEFSPEALACAENAVKAAKDISNRKLQNEIIFTIDGADAKDLDDAVSITKSSDGTYTLGVHIADVAEYVRARTPLDREARRRGTSVYFVDKVIPMLPAVLSCDACSLNAGEKKLAVSAIIKLSERGEIIDTEIEESIIVSRVRGVYSEVNDIFQNGRDSEFFDKYAEVAPSLEMMRELYTILKSRSDARGAMDLDAPEAKFILGNDGNIEKIVRRERGEAERLIEQFMLCANEAVATLLTKRGIPCVYRIHEEPPADKLSGFITYAHNLGLSTSRISKDNVCAADFQALLLEARKARLEPAIINPLLRTMAKAKYSERPLGHFGLGIGLYCHFTSPIRRYSDTATHRIIKDVLICGREKSRYKNAAARASVSATEGELRALDAERKIEELYKTIYMASHIGEAFDAVISSIGSFGMFCILDNTCEGIIPISEMPGYFIFDEQNLTLTSGGTVYRIGMTVRIKVEGADLSERRVRFSLEGEPVVHRAYSCEEKGVGNRELHRKKAKKPSKKRKTSR